MHVCVVGTSRCGTTLLRNCLDRHPSLSLFNETHWIPKMFELCGTRAVPGELLLGIAQKTTWDTGRELLAVNAELAGCGSRERLLERFTPLLGAAGRVTIRGFSELLARSLFGDVPFWGDKTPDYGFYMGQIQLLWPGSRFIHMVRGGLATARSLSRHPGCVLMTSNGFDNWCSLSYDRAYERYRPRELPLEAYVSAWRRRLARIRDEATRLREGTYREIAYETLVDDTASRLREAAEFLGLECPETWLEECTGLIRPRKPVPADGALMQRLPPEDLLALNACDETGYLLLPVDADRGRAEALLTAGKARLHAGDSRFAGRAAASVLAVAAADGEAALREAALALRHAALGAAGTSPATRRDPC